MLKPQASPPPSPPPSPPLAAVVPAAASPRRRFTSPPLHLAAVSPAAVSPAAVSRDRLHESIDVLGAIIEILHSNALVAAVGANIVNVDEDPRDAVDGNAGVA